MQRATNTLHSTSDFSSVENDEDLQNEESEWSCCSEVSGFAAENYKCNISGATKRKRGTSIVHVSRHPHSTTDEETIRSSQDENPGLDSFPFAQTRQIVENFSPHASDQEM
jgi:hypothetical protein